MKSKAGSLVSILKLETQAKIRELPTAANQQGGERDGERYSLRPSAVDGGVESSRVPVRERCGVRATPSRHGQRPAQISRLHQTTGRFHTFSLLILSPEFLFCKYYGIIVVP